MTGTVRLPPEYHAALLRFDPELRVRWSDRRQRWLLERKARFSRLSIDPAHYGYAEHDTVVQLRDGYFELGSYAPRELPPVDRLCAYLRTQDVRRRGDQDLDHLANAIADELEAREQAAEEAARAAHDRDVGDRAADLWEDDRWQQRLRVAVPASLPR